MKVCKKCGVEKDLSDFYKKPRMADGHLNHCIPCVKAYEKQRRLKVIDHLIAYDKARQNLPHRVQARKEYAKTEAGKLAHKKALNTYRVKYPLKHAAKAVVAHAIKLGTITRASTCSECGSDNKIEGHHDSYLEPLNVRWLCEKCHKAWHKTNKAIYE